MILIDTHTKLSIVSAFIILICYRIDTNFDTNISIDLLRVIRNGLMVKDAVDAAIDQCSDVYNLRDSIEDSRMRAEQASNDQARKSYAQRGNTKYSFRIEGLVSN